MGGLSWAWQARNGITSLGRDARGLTFTVVIQARVMQPGGSTGWKQNWRMARCQHGKAFAPRHPCHVWTDAYRAHLLVAHRLGWCLAGFSWRVRVGLNPWPPLNFKLGHRHAMGGAGGYLFPYLLPA
jgi:hypothetical protein